MTPGFASPGSDGPLERESESAWVMDPAGAFPVDLRTGARGGDVPLPPPDELQQVLIPGIDVALVRDPRRSVFVPLDRRPAGPAGPEDPPPPA